MQICIRLQCIPSCTRKRFISFHVGKIHLGRLIQYQKVWHRAFTLHKMLVKGQKSDQMATEVVLTSAQSLHWNGASRGINNYSQIINIEPELALMFKLQPPRPFCHLTSKTIEN